MLTNIRKSAINVTLEYLINKNQEENYDYGRWYKIIHNYTDFEILIICVDVSEEEALLNETVWAYQNNANFKFHIMEQKFKTWEHMAIVCNF